MTTFQKLKHEARRAEQRSDWARAIDLYQQALDTDEDMADLSLYNRIGDLYLRLGKNEAAVDCYERAVDRYADHGMLTSAIALCNKVLRIAPGRTSIYRRLGSLHARTGLVVEGRANTLNFARHALEQGKVVDAERAVAEFAELTGDEEIRVGFAAALEAAGDPSAAAGQLRSVHRLRKQRGEDVDGLRARIEELTPGGTTDQEDEAAPDPEPAVSGDAAPVRLAREVAARLEGDAASGFEIDAPAPTAGSESPVDDGLDDVRRELGRFRERVRPVLEGDDLTVRYDLGVEFMTIGLLDEAIEEFQAAVADPALVEAANARIGECLALRTAGSSFEMIRRVPVTAPATPPAEPDGADEPDDAAEPVSTDEAGAAEDVLPAAEEEPATPPAGEAPAAEEAPADDEIQGHFFRARLAQYRIRRAEDRHTVDHAAHLDLGTSYVGMDLFQEALRELNVALGGPRPVSLRAARILQGLALHEDAPADVALQVLERLAVSDHPRIAASLGTQLAEAWGHDEARSARLSELRARLSEDVEELPALEDLFPSMGAEPAAVAEPAPESGEVRQPVDAAPEAEEGEEGGEEAAAPPVHEIADAEELEELDDLLAELEREDAESSAARADAPPETESVEAALAAADELEGAGDADAAIERLHASFGRLGEAGRTREALTVLDRLLELEPDEEGLHHQRTELAEMANDRDRLLAAWMGLGACLRRKGDDRRARAAYGHMLDIDPESTPAREAIAAIDADELERERSAAAEHRDTPGPSRPAPASAEDAELEALLEELEGGAEVGEAVSVGEEDHPPAAARRNGDGGADAMTRSRYELGLAFRQMGMWDEAVRELRPALDGVEDRLTALEALGECLLKCGRAGEAIELLRDNLRADEDAEQVAPLYFLGLALQVEGEAEEAREVFGRVEAVRPGYRDTADRLSELSL